MNLNKPNIRQYIKKFTREKQFDKQTNLLFNSFLYMKYSTCKLSNGNAIKMIKS